MLTLKNKTSNWGWASEVEENEPAHRPNMKAVKSRKKKQNQELRGNALFNRAVENLFSIKYKVTPTRTRGTINFWELMKDWKNQRLLLIRKE